MATTTSAIAAAEVACQCQPDLWAGGAMGIW